jgi:3-hydroxyacyl-[acyl-carrier-protein] dehydratase
MVSLRTPGETREERKVTERMIPSLPHGPGFSFLQSVEFHREGKRAVAWYQWSPDDAFVRDHFPGRPMVPGTLLVESAAQAAGCLWAFLLGKEKGQPFLLARVTQFRFLRPVLPPARVRHEVSLEKELGSLALFRVALFCREELVSEGQVVLAKMEAATGEGPALGQTADQREGP